MRIHSSVSRLPSIVVVSLIAAASLTPTRTAWAQAPDASARESASISESTPASEDSTMLWIYLAAVGLGLGMGGVWIWRRRRRARTEDVDDAVMVLPVPPGGAGETADEHAGASQTGEYAIFSMSNLADARDNPVEPPPTPRAEIQKNRCPRCRRTFPSTIALCPYDHTPLESTRQAASMRRRSGGRTLMARQMCPSCGRRYASGARFCPYDGASLVADAFEDVESAPVFRVCPACGDHADERGAERCAHDGEELVVVDPGASQASAPAIPVSVCPRCHHVGAPGQAFCPHDDEVLVPMTETRPRTFPHTGIGPERKICTSCGSTFCGQTSHCAFDGTALVDMQ
jgi:uncharacterized OB-fold protein